MQPSLFSQHAIQNELPLPNIDPDHALNT